MKLSRRILAVFAALCLILALVPAAFADGEGVDAADDTTATNTEERFAVKSWDDVVSEFLAEMGATEDQVGLGYCNTVTGEEHYLNGEVYFDAASMFKVPLNMYYTEKISRGELELEGSVYGYTYKNMLEETIINSNNEHAVYLWQAMGGYRTYRESIAEYMGVDKDNVDPKYYANNYFTPQQMVHCLRLLATEPERFPYLIETMELAEPDNYFRRDEKRFNIAHKYGYVHNDSDACYYLNDSAIVYTDEPIVIVMFTKSAVDAYGLLARYCTLMCDYAQYHTTLDRQNAAESGSGADKNTIGVVSLDRTEELPSLTSPVSGEEMLEKMPVNDLSFGSLVLLVLIFVAAVVALVMLIKLRFMKKLNFLWGLMALVFAVAGLVACVIGADVGTLITRPDGDPQQTVDTFFGSILGGDYDSAYACLDDYSDLGLDSAPADAVGKKIYEALKESYSYRLAGECVVNGLTATQQVEFRYFDLTKISDELETTANEYIEELVAQRSRSELYDENDRYLTSVTDEVYAYAINSVLSHAQDFYTTVILDVELSYTDGTWSLSTSQPMLNALTGGTAY